MNFTTQEMEELVPESTLVKCQDKPAGEVFTMRDQEGNTFSILQSNPFWLKLITARSQLKYVQQSLETIIHLTEQNPGGYLEIGEYDPNDTSPKDLTVAYVSEIRGICKEVLDKITKREG